MTAQWLEWLEVEKFGRVVNLTPSPTPGPTAEPVTPEPTPSPTFYRDIDFAMHPDATCTSSMGAPTAKPTLAPVEEPRAPLCRDRETFTMGWGGCEGYAEGES